MDVISKQFTTHKRGETDIDNQDSIYIDVNNHRYALSDGVSMSFLPRLLADVLTEKYVASSKEEIFPPNNLSDLFQQRKEEYLASLDEFGTTLQEIAEETFVTGAATFVGLALSDQNLSYCVLGDSCLFIISERGRMRCICSEKIVVEQDESIYVAFGNHPCQIHSDGKVIGEFIEETIPLEAGWIILMSDKISKWFIDRYNAGDNALEQLFSLQSNEEFEALIEAEFQAGRIDNDDCSAIIIRVQEPDSNLCPSNNDASEGSSLKEDEINQTPPSDATNDGNIDSVSNQAKHRPFCFWLSKLSKVIKRIFKLI